LGYTPAVAARSVHHIVAAVALAGLYAAALAWGRTNASKSPEAEVADATRVGSWAGCLALAAALLQVPVGIWVLLTMPNNRVLMGDDLLATGMFIAAVIAALGLMQHLAAIAFGDLTRKNVVVALALYVIVIVLMTSTRVLSRSVAERNRAAAVEIESTCEPTVRFS
jgi:heme A synthase